MKSTLALADHVMLLSSMPALGQGRGRDKEAHQTRR